VLKEPGNELKGKSNELRFMAGENSSVFDGCEHGRLIAIIPVAPWRPCSMNLAPFNHQ
jgi:hypothetical protein